MPETLSSSDTPEPVNASPKAPLEATDLKIKLTVLNMCLAFPALWTNNINNKQTLEQACEAVYQWLKKQG